MARKKRAGPFPAPDNLSAKDPDTAKAWFDLGINREDQGEFADAMTSYKKALSINPQFPEAHYNLALLLKNKTGDSAAAERHYRMALSAKPDFPDALNNLGILLQNRGEFEESITFFKKSLSLKPFFLSALNNLGLSLHFVGAFEESISILNKALALQPDNPDILNNLGSSLRVVGKLTEAIAVLSLAIEAKNDRADFHCNLALALLTAGRFEEGWSEFEWRWRTAPFAGIRRNITKPLWRGEEAGGRVLLIRAEQGLGDTIQFCRYASRASGRGCRVMMEVQPVLVRLASSLPGVERVIPWGRPLPDYDLYCPMMNLPGIFNTRLETIPAEIPYLSVDDGNIERWRNHLSNGEKDKLKVGLAWAGGKRNTSPGLIAADRRRSIHPALLAPITKIPGVRFFSLQKNGPPGPAELGMIDMMDECNDFAETAAFIANLDLVISVDTAVAHLAGALGKPVWILNRFDSCWRWLATRENSPWYPTLRLFRQPRPGDWESVVTSVERELRNVLANPATAIPK